jgi:Fe(3+) dicitrate transport protein
MRPRLAARVAVLTALAAWPANAQATGDELEARPGDADEEAYEIEVTAGPPPAEGSAREEGAPDEDPTEITVVGFRAPRVPGAAHVIRSAALERTEYDDPHAVLQTVPGVYVRHEDGLGLRPNIGIRGAASDRTKKVTLMEDGILLGPAPYSAPAAYYFPLITRFSQIRVVKGPSAIMYGPQTVGGAIDFVTRSVPASDRGEVDLAAGQYGYGKAHAWAGSSTDRLGFMVEGVHVRADGFKELPGGEDTGFYRNEVMLKSSYVPDPGARVPNEFTAKLSYSDELSNETYLGLTDADFRANALQRYAPSQLDQMTWHRTGFSLGHRVQPSRAVEIRTTFYRNDLSRAWRKVNRFGGRELFPVLSDPSAPGNAIYASILRGETDSSSASDRLLIGPNQRAFVSQGIQTTVTWDATTGPFAHHVEYGLRLHHDRVERRHTEDAYNVIGGDLALVTGSTRVTAFNEAWTEAGALHASDAVTWDRLTVTPGVRVEVMRSASIDRRLGTEERGATQVVLPGGGAYFALTETFGALAGVYRGFSPPPPGSPDTTAPELSVNYEAGIRYAEGPSRAELIGYYNDYSNLTDVCTISTGCLDVNLDRQFDAGSALIYGGEVYLAHDFPLGGGLKLPLSAAYTLTLTRFGRTFESEDPTFGNVQAGDELPYVPRHQANALVGLEHDRVGGYATATYVSRMREEAGSGPLEEALTTDEQFILDAGTFYRVLPWLRLYGNVRNVLDSQYVVSRRPFGARPNAPRWLQVGVKATF